MRAAVAEVPLDYPAVQVALAAAAQVVQMRMEAMQQQIQVVAAVEQEPSTQM